MRLITIMLLILLSACSSQSIYQTQGVKKPEGRKLYGSPQEDKQAIVQQKGKILYMVTSYYGEQFHGKYTSNGEIFDMYKLTCAHKELPFGTRLRVTNEDNGKSVIVRVNDRGPFIYGRDLDLSYAAAVEVGLIEAGVKSMKVEILD